jgi:hypothetical protein
MAARLSALRTGRCFTPQKHYFFMFLELTRKCGILDVSLPSGSARAVTGAVTGAVTRFFTILFLIVERNNGTTFCFSIKIK